MTTSKDPLLECPDWYEEAWQTGNYPIPDALKRAGYGEAKSSRGIASGGNDDDANSVSSNANSNANGDDASNGVKGDAANGAQNGVTEKDDVINGRD